MGVGINYTTAVDLSALGVVIHEVLTSEIPFQETYLDINTYQDSDQVTLTSNVGPELDPHMLYRYCQGLEPFPVGCMQKHQVDADGIDFVTNLMVVNPHDRASATDALDCQWLEIEPSEINIPPAAGPELLRIQFELLGIRLSPKDTNRLFVEENRSIILRILNPSAAKGIWIRSATSKGYVEVVKVLLKVNGYIDYPQDGMSLLQLAASEGQVAVMQLLLNRGASVNGPASNNGQTALQAAAGGGHLEAINLLLAKGAYANAPGSNTVGTALQAAARGGHLDAVRVLLNKGVDVNTSPKGNPARSALQAALQADILR